MQLTLDIPDNIAERATAQASSEGVPLQELVARALLNELHSTAFSKSNSMPSRYELIEENGLKVLSGPIPDVDVEEAIRHVRDQIRL
ncbi:MAG TPA: hypothetical protein VEH27_04405 [Methylomirabilota bacterium]|nr:hypothetical protein [Methylomirabilota bacterium]